MSSHSECIRFSQNRQRWYAPVKCLPFSKDWWSSLWNLFVTLLGSPRQKYSVRICHLREKSLETKWQSQFKRQTITWKIYWLTEAFVDWYQSGMATWWLNILRGTHFFASAAHRIALRSGKLWWMSIPSLLHRPRDQPMSSEPCVKQKKTTIFGKFKDGGTQIYDHRWNSVSSGGGKCGVIIKRLSRGIKPGTGGTWVAETDQKILWSIHTVCQTNNML